MTPLNFLALFHLFLSGSSIFTPEQLKATFIDPKANHTHEIDPLKLCQEYSEFEKSEDRKLLDIGLAELPKRENIDRLYGHDVCGRKIYDIKFNNAPAAVRIMSRDDFESDIKNELYFWIKTFVSHPEDALSFKFCLYDKKKFYLVTEFMEGDLSNFASDFKFSFSAKQKLQLLRRMVEIVSHVQELNISHQDIKPQNFVIRYTSPDEYTLKIFGFLLAEEKAEKNSLLGSLPFMPPESLQEQNAYRNQSGDIWAIGMTLLSLLTDTYMLDFQCYSVSYTSDCYSRLRKNIIEYFSDAFRFKDRSITKISDAENIMDVILLMLDYSPINRPSAADVIKRLEHLEVNSKII